MFDFGLNEHQQELQASIRRYLDREFTSAELRKTLELPERFSRKHWQDIADLGCLGIGVAEEYGGSGLGCVETAVVLESLGRAVFPGPYLETITAAAVVSEAGNPDQKAKYLPKFCSGDMMATYAIDEPGGYWNADAVQAQAVRNGNSYEFHGTKLWVAYADEADLIVCALRTSERTADGRHGISLFALETENLGLKIGVLDGMDDAYRLCEVCLDQVVVPAAQMIGPLDQGWPIWTDAARLATVLAGADMIGGMEKCLEMIVDYSKERVQFGKPIGSYQVVKHRCADMLIDLEAVRGSVYYAAWALQKRAPGFELAVSSAKAYASDAYVRTTEKSLQSFGAIGFTWDHDIHLYLKRAKRLEMSLGNAMFHRERIAALWL